MYCTCHFIVITSLPFAHRPTQKRKQEMTTTTFSEKSTWELLTTNINTLMTFWEMCNVYNKGQIVKDFMHRALLNASKNTQLFVTEVFLFSFLQLRWPINDPNCLQVYSKCKLLDTPSEDTGLWQLPKSILLLLSLNKTTFNRKIVLIIVSALHYLESSELVTRALETKYTFCFAHSWPRLFQMT